MSQQRRLTATVSKIIFHIHVRKRRTTSQAIRLAFRPQGSGKIIISSWQVQIYNAKFLQEGNIFPALFESELLLHVKNSAVKQNLLQVKIC